MVFARDAERRRAGIGSARKRCTGAGANAARARVDARSDAAEE